MTDSAASFGPRERAAAEGIDSLGGAELVALVLGTGPVGKPVGLLAATLVEEHGGIGGLARAGVGGLATHPGLGWAKAARVAAAFELGRRAAAEGAVAPTLRFPDSASVDAWARPRLALLEHEELWLLALDGLNGLRAARRIASGGLHSMHVALRDPLRVALREGASAFVLVHNHPSGDPTPSHHDVEFSKSVLEASILIGVPLLDHVIVGRPASASLLALGAIPPASAATTRRREQGARKGTRTRPHSQGRA